LDGTASVLVTGLSVADDAPKCVFTLEKGDAFGDIGLHNNVSRSATVMVGKEEGTLG
jgi:hypothetical protein